MSLNEDLEMLVKFLESEDFKRATEISRRSITEMVEMQDKAKKYDELESLLSDLIKDFRDDKSLGSFEIGIYGGIESIITSEKRSQE